jgi:hypothetical protein
MKETFICDCCNMQGDMNKRNEGRVFVVQAKTENFLLDIFSDLKFYNVAEKTLVANVCDLCIKAETQKVYFKISSLLIAGVTLILLDLQLDWGKWGIIIGMFLIGITLVGLTNSPTDRGYITDQLAIKAIMGKLSKEVRKTKGFNLITRKDRKKMIKTSR